MTEEQIARFWSHVDQSGGPDACWPWLGRRYSQGYGAVTILKRIYLAHRLAYELTTGPIPPTICVLHSCDVPACVNPKHLWLGTHIDNMRDKVLKGRCRSGGLPKFTSAQRAAIRERYAQGDISYRTLALEYGCSFQGIQRIVKQ